MFAGNPGWKPDKNFSRLFIGKTCSATKEVIYLLINIMIMTMSMVMTIIIINVSVYRTFHRLLLQGDLLLGRLSPLLSESNPSGLYFILVAFPPSPPALCSFSSLLVDFLFTVFPSHFFVFLFLFTKTIQYPINTRLFQLISKLSYLIQ